MASATEKPLFDKILIANRGEIVGRVAKTARKMGIKTVGIYSDADAHALHVRMTDESVCVGPAPSAQSYLNMERILQACKETGAQAVHPGYGFLSENHHFQEMLQAEGIKFIGPGTRAITAMGDKIESKKIAAEAGVNTVPGHLGVVHTDEEVKRIANEIGYPVMIKASAGGGGKGMRIAWNDVEAVEGFKLSTEEAKSSFGDDRIFIEKFIVEPRHIEIQLVADSQGSVLTLPERECSIQRRNQKVIEESPSVLLDEETRAAMQAQAAALAHAVDYESAGTVEFLCDRDLNFYFLEMNTRLQVEHPVTEYVSGIDLVEQMIKVAAGLPIAPELLDKPLPIIGHAVEARVYAEDPFRGFLPSTGRLEKYIEPQASICGMPEEELRLDAGVIEGSEISMFYDPMIAKLVTHGSTRAESLERLRRALDAYVIRGVGHNVPFLRDVAGHPRHESGKISTAFIDEEYPDGFHGVSLNDSQQSKLVASAHVMHLLDVVRDEHTTGRAASAPHSSLLGAPTYITVSGGPDAPEGGRLFQSVLLRANEEDAEDETQAMERAADSDEGDDRPLGYVAIVSEVTDDQLSALHEMEAVDPAKATKEVLQALQSRAIGDTANATIVRLDNIDWLPSSPLFVARAGIHHASEEYSSHDLVVQHISKEHEGFRLSLEGGERKVAVRGARQQQLARWMIPKLAIDTSKAILSPMPGKLVELEVEVGDHVENGQPVAVIEAMKMQNVLRAPRAGRVKAVNAAAGDTLAVDEIIMEFEDEE